MKKTFRAVALLLVCLFVLSTAAFADAADSEFDQYIIGTWKAYVLSDEGTNTDLESADMPITINADHTGTFFFDKEYPLTWSYKSTDESYYAFDCYITDENGQTYHQLLTYITNYGDLSGMLCFMIGEKTAIFYVK